MSDYEANEALEMARDRADDAENEVELLQKELATLRANQLSPAIVAAVRAYQEAYLEHRKASVLVLGGTRDVSIAWDNLQIAIEADAKERG